MVHTPRPVANGLRTDHPDPDLPFVDDSHLALNDPAAIEDVGRETGHGMWGRYDEVGENGGWIAYTTDPYNHALGWLVRYEPGKGRSVLLYRDGDAAIMHAEFSVGSDPDRRVLLLRQGGYWWDGTTWYRPAQVWDWASERCEARPVKAAVTVSAADLLDDTADADLGRLLKVSNIAPDDPGASSDWIHDLARWAADRPDDALPLEECVVKVSAPELAADQLVGQAEFARIGGIAPGTLRSYISRDESDIPPPQAVISGRAMWARTVAADWAEEHRRSPEEIAAAVSAGESLAPGAAEARDHFAKVFYNQLWANTERRRRWARRYRTEEAVADTAQALGFSAATTLDRVVPIDALAATIRTAFLGDLAKQARNGKAEFFAWPPQLAKTLDWLVRHKPARAQRVVGEIIGEAERNLELPRDEVAAGLRRALMMDSTLDREQITEFCDRALPAAGAKTPRS